MRLSSNIKFSQAISKFSPDEMAKRVVRAQSGTVYFDKSSLIRTVEDESMFFYVLSHIYMSGYKNIENLTVYFEPEVDGIIAGAYAPENDIRISRVKLISCCASTPYTYTREDIENFKNILNNA